MEGENTAKAPRAAHRRSACPGRQRRPRWGPGGREGGSGLRRGLPAVSPKSLEVWEAGPLAGSEVTRAEPHGGVGVLTEETPELLAPPAMRGRSEKTRSVNQEVGSRQTLHPLGPRPRPASRRKGGRHPPAARKPPRRGSCRGGPHRPRQKPRRAEGPTKKLLFGTGRQKAGLRGAGGAEGRGVHTRPSRELRRCRGGQGVHFIINTCG